jgi:ribulose-5-phosphate 4-epimerase/fuculose-1-phosphate aldolase
VKFEKLECVVLARDIAEHGLRTGDLGTIVEIYPEGGVEVEFVTGSGVTQALLTLTEQDIRKIDSLDLPATRRLARVK